METPRPRTSLRRAAALLAAGLVCAALAAAPSVVAAAPSASHGRPAPPVAHGAAPTAAAPAVVPGLRSWEAGSGTFHLRSGSRIVVDPAHASELRDDARQFSADLAAEGVEHLPVVVSAAPGAGDIRLTVRAGLGAEAYDLSVTGIGVTVGGGGGAGVFYGEQAVEQLLKSAADKATLGTGHTEDRPQQAERGLMIDTAREYWPVSDIEQTIREMAWTKLNTFHWHVTDSEAFRLRLPGYGDLAAARSYTSKDVRDIEAYARKYHVSLIPEMDVPGHATSLTAVHPGLRWDCASMNQVIHAGRIDPGFTVDITKKQNVAWLDGLVRSFLSVFDSPTVHLGGDETPDAQLQSQCPELTDYAKARGYAKTEDALLAYENHLDDLVRAHGRTLELWGWWPQAGGSGSVTVEKDVRIQAWLGDEADFLAQGYHVVVSNEHSRLYVVPKDPPGTANGNYIPDDATLYNTYAPDPSELVDGVEMAEWGDNAYYEPASYFAHYLRRPLQILASAAWNGPQSGSYLDYEAVADRVGTAPGIPDLITPGSSALSGNPYGAADASVAFDGDPATAFSGSDAGLDLGSGRRAVLTGARILPRSDSSADLAALVGGRIQGCATGPDSGCRDLSTITLTPSLDWLTLPVDGSVSYRWFRYLAPSGSATGAAEIQFLTAPATPATATVLTSGHLTPTAGTAIAVEVRNTSSRAIVPAALAVSAVGLADQGALHGRVIDPPRTLAPGRAARVSVSLPTAGAAPGTYRIVAELTGRDASVTSSAERTTVRGTATAELPVTSLKQSFDNIGTTDDANYELGSVDGARSSFSRQNLVAAGAAPGQGVRADGFRYTWPDAEPGEPDNALAHGQTVPVAGQGGYLGLLVTATYAPAGGLTASGTLAYTDGTTSAYTVTVPDWASDASGGATLAVHGTKVNANNTAQVTRSANVFSVSVPTDPAKHLASVTLPAGHAYVTSGQPALHIFALATRHP